MEGVSPRWRSGEGFEAEWRDVLNQEGVNGSFHMADFERWVKPFDFTLADGSRDYERHKRLLNGLLEVIGRRSPHTFGFTRDVPTKRMSKAFKDTYENCIATCYYASCKQSPEVGLDDRISIIFARHRDFSLNRIEKYYWLYELWRREAGHRWYRHARKPMSTSGGRYYRI